jgi:aryl-alcohol dehydrogenase-like predicted oxidoreductase
MEQLEQSLRRLQTDRLDLWQIHEVIYFNDPDLIFARNGAAEALLAAKQQGKVRFVGFTGHKDPAIHLRMLAHDFPFDTVQMPLNCFDATFRSFGTALCDQRGSSDHYQWDGLAGGAGAKSDCGTGLQASGGACNADVARARACVCRGRALRAFQDLEKIRR